MRLKAVSIAVLSLAASTLVHASSAASKVAIKPDITSLNGYWDVEDESRKTGQERPQLTPAAAARVKAQQAAGAARQAQGLVVGLGTYICGENGVPNVYTTSEPWSLIVTKDEVVQVAERPSIRPRHFWMDGRTFPADLSRLPRSSNGHSIAHWDGADLVVETRAMPPGNVPGGGLKGPDTVLTERFHLIEGGKKLELSITAADPAIYTRPYTLKYVYDRRELGTYAFTDFCDPNHDMGKTNSGQAEVRN